MVLSRKGLGRTGGVVFSPVGGSGDEVDEVDLDVAFVLSFGVVDVFDLLDVFVTRTSMGA